jgi:hypothetical protein
LPFDFYSLYPLLAKVGSDGCRGCPSSGRSVPQPMLL